MEDDKRFPYFLLGFGIGVAVGVLFAPKSGEETRQLIRAKAGESTEYIKKRGGEFRQSASELYEKGRDAITRQKDNLAAAVRAGKDAYQEAVGDGAGV